MVDIHNLLSLLPAVNQKLNRDFGYTVDIGELNGELSALDEVLDFDVENLLNAAKESILWKTYTADVRAILEIALGKYKNVLDVYEYLDSISVKDPDLFSRTAPKYKIDTRNLPLAIKELQAKKEELGYYVKAIRMIIADCSSVEDYLNAIHHKCNALVLSAERRAFNSAL